MSTNGGGRGVGRPLDGGSGARQSTLSSTSFFSNSNSNTTVRKVQSPSGSSGVGIIGNAPAPPATKATSAASAAPSILRQKLVPPKAPAFDVGAARQEAARYMEVQVDELKRQAGLSDSQTSAQAQTQPQSQSPPSASPPPCFAEFSSLFRGVGMSSADECGRLLALPICRCRSISIGRIQSPRPSIFCGSCQWR